MRGVRAALRREDREVRQRLTADALQVANVVEVRPPGRDLLELTGQPHGVHVSIEQLVDQISQMAGGRHRIAVQVEQLLLTSLQPALRMTAGSDV